MFAAGSDPDIWKVHPVPDRYTEAGFRKFFDGAVNSRMGFAFVDRATGRIIGSSRYYGYEPDLSEIEIGWTFLARSHWGGRANREVERLMLDHAFTFVDTVIFWVGDPELALAGRDDQDWRHQARGPVHPGVVRREAVFHLRDYEGAVSAGWPGAGGMRGGRAGLPRDGDGNHFAYVGHLKSTGHAALVTHHGSRGLGAQLYKRGMAVARKHTAIHAPNPDQNAWIKASSEYGRAYWEALQIVDSGPRPTTMRSTTLPPRRPEMVSPIASGTNTTSFSERQMACSTTARELPRTGPASRTMMTDAPSFRSTWPNRSWCSSTGIKGRAWLRAPRRRSQRRTQGFPARERASAAGRHRCPFLLR